MRGNTPVVQDQDEISRLEGQLVVFGRLKVVERADLPHLLAAAAADAGVARGVRGQGPGLRLLLLLLQGQLDGCVERNGRRRRTEMGRAEIMRRVEAVSMCIYANTIEVGFTFSLF